MQCARVLKIYSKYMHHSIECDVSETKQPLFSISEREREIESKRRERVICESERQNARTKNKINFQIINIKIT